jgi:hypothetical protein
MFFSSIIHIYNKTKEPDKTQLNIWIHLYKASGHKYTVELGALLIPVSRNYSSEVVSMNSVGKDMERIFGFQLRKKNFI